MKSSRKKSVARKPVKAAKIKRAAPVKRPAAKKLSRDFAPPLKAAGVVPPPWDREFDDHNVPGLGRCAATAFERKQALDHAVTNVWTTEDISVIRRVESGGQCKWAMSRRATLPPT
jgi:hypothetical protein